MFSPYNDRTSPQPQPLSRKPAMSRLAATLPLLLSLFVLPHTQAAEPGAPGYHLLKKIEIGGDGGWDYLTLDSVTRRLYIARPAQPRSGQVEIGA